MQKSDNSQKSRCVLFDFDGVVAASEGVKSDTHVQTCLRLGGTPSVKLNELYKDVMGRPSLESRYAFLECARIEPSPEIIQSYQDIYRSIYRDRLADIRCTPGVEKILHTLQSRGCQIGLVSSSRIEVIDIILKNNRVDHFFSAIVSSEIVPDLKPSPKPYLKALEMLGFDRAPENVLVIEDTQPGITAAKNAGLKAIALRHHLNERQNLEKADYFFDSLEDDRLLQLIDKFVDNQL